MKTIKVAAAIIQNNGKILATQRNYGDFAGGWEFPGGKLEDGETSLDACRREILEELEVELCDEEFLTKVEYDYPTFHLDMDCYLCKIARGEIVLHDHSHLAWVGKDDIDSVEWLPADAGLVPMLKAKLA
ncbi:(deoxy)nucleoside triphosphate pyrophosphohydrolase [Slackia heliotrinireducens]|uniref:8-oxo-dGTP diphosphatase n=1 Tax=Slackia heliotrinireducens (strain ATCC 29202 / DSM 20476 / NCTC 11029 / RHS 1) TaxID=471855 RepID=C7N5J3_SLAHD|nr:(deoxy)nucleoside triphosphate pyrophosphohydrolase [Slackia heliotrinireducens]ACV22178.1 ADP-ribose pyrophosphatase [Slackia heliotrinireducens DSM 20476]VEH00258.1 CTP pyrophosphohydrolase [Slackia heliotrinireducens]